MPFVEFRREFQAQHDQFAGATKLLCVRSPGQMPVVGMVGGGQRARMTQQAAIALGVRLRVLSATAEDSAALVVSDVHVGSHESLEDLMAFAKGCDVITWDHE